MVMILIPANPGQDFEGGSQVGSIEAHLGHISEKSKVFWRLVPPGSKWLSRIKHEPQIGYFLSVYDNRESLITHRFKIEEMFNASLFPDDYLDQRNLRPFVPPFRDYHINSGWLILITNIAKLDISRNLNDFIKFQGKTPVRRVQNFVWVEDLEYK